MIQRSSPVHLAISALWLELCAVFQKRSSRNLHVNGWSPMVIGAPPPPPPSAIGLSFVRNRSKSRELRRPIFTAHVDSAGKIAAHSPVRVVQGYSSLTDDDSQVALSVAVSLGPFQMTLQQNVTVPRTASVCSQSPNHQIIYILTELLTNRWVH